MGATLALTSANQKDALEKAFFDLTKPINDCKN